MNYSGLLNVVSLIVPVLIAGTKSIIRGNEKYIIAILTYFVLKKISEQSALSEVKQKLQETGAHNANALAQMYRQAMNPSGYVWLMPFDGTNEEAIFELARTTPNFQSVAIAYKAQFGTELVDDLRKELSSSDFNRFLGILNGLSYGT